MRSPLATILAAVALAAALAAAQPASAADGFPGSTWGELHLDVPRPGRTDLVLEGWTRQGITWTSWRAGTTELLLQPYATFRYKWDSEGLEWNSALGPGVGLSLDLRVPDGPLISAGVELVHQWNYRSGTARPYAAPFLNWYHWWALAGPGWPGSTWGDLRWELPSSGADDLVLQGWIRQGLVVARWPLGGQTLLLGPSLRLRYAADTAGLAWNNSVGLGAGLALDLERERGPTLSWGVEYTWQRNLRPAGDVQLVTLFMRWYGWWDLGGR